MLDFLHSILNLGPRKPGIGQFVRANELGMIESAPPFKERMKFESNSLLQKEIKGNSGAKVKIVMRKEKAARLLAKCRNGGTLELKDVAPDFRRMPRGNAVTLLSYNTKDE